MSQVYYRKCDKCGTTINKEEMFARCNIVALNSGNINRKFAMKFDTIKFTSPPENCSSEFRDVNFELCQKCALEFGLDLFWKSV